MSFYIPPDFHFANPYIAILLLLFFPVYSIFNQTLEKKRQADLIFYQSLFSAKRENWNALFLAIAFFSFVLCLMEPVGYAQKQQPSETLANLNQPLPVLFLLDTSLSMETSDGSFKRSRIEQAKELIASFLPQLSSYPKALYTFQDHLQPIIPLTYETTFINFTLDALSPIPSKDGTDFLLMLTELQSLLQRKDVMKPRQIVLLSDGEDTTINPNIKQMKEIASSLANNGITFTAIGLGTSEGMPIPDLTFDGKPVISHLNEPLLKAIATAGGGRYVDPNNFSVNSLTQELTSEFKTVTYQSLLSAQPKVTYLPLFPLFLLIGLLALLRGFTR